MAKKPLFELSDLIPAKVAGQRTITGTARLNGLLNIRVKRLPEAAIINGFKAAIFRANSRIQVDLKEALDQALKSSVWSTKNGSADIFDSGELLSSGSVSISESGITIAYDAPYATLVHYGGYIHPYGNTSARVYLPPRPWVESVLNGGGPVPEFDFPRYYKEEIEAEFS